MKSSKMYVLVNGDLGMSIGKTAAQVAHAVARVSFTEAPYSVVVLEATTEQLHNMKAYLAALGVRNALYIDEGANEIPPMSVTALAVEPLTDDTDFEPDDIFGGFKLLKKKGILGR